MYRDKTILAVIPARIGSKRLPEKNIRPMLGKPLIAWTIEEAAKSKYLDRIVVSTDDIRIAEISRSFGAEVPFMRPERLSTDHSSSSEVLMHALSFFVEHGVNYDYAALLQPTSPLREASDIDNCIKQLINIQSAKSIVSVTKLHEKSQEYPLNGMLYITEIEFFLLYKTLHNKHTLTYEVGYDKSVDIDGVNDFVHAEALLKKKVSMNAEFFVKP